tara:strand:- start:263 stop:682 length:420 start_codon:yes stop_codon:yes gene_type:complete
MSNSSSQRILKLKALTYNNLASQYLRDSFYDKSEDYALKSLEIKKGFGDNYSLAVAHKSPSNIYYFKKDYKKCLEILYEGLALLDSLNGDRIDKLRSDFYLNIAYSIYRFRDYRSYEYYGKAWRIYNKTSQEENERVFS